MRPLKIGDKVLYGELPAVIRFIYDDGYASIVMHSPNQPGPEWHVMEDIVPLTLLTRRRLRYGGDGMLHHAAKDWGNIPDGED